VITDGVTPSLHIGYQHAAIKPNAPAWGLQFFRRYHDHSLVYGSLQAIPRACSSAPNLVPSNCYPTCTRLRGLRPRGLRPVATRR
jgi:hypothetical protein